MKNPDVRCMADVTIRACSSKSGASGRGNYFRGIPRCRSAWIYYNPCFAPSHQESEQRGSHAYDYMYILKNEIVKLLYIPPQNTSLGGRCCEGIVLFDIIIIIMSGRHSIYWGS